MRIDSIGSMYQPTKCSHSVCFAVPVLTVSLPFKGMCQPRKMGTVGAEPFSAKLRYTGAEDPKHPNLIKVTVTMPHIDGM